MFQKSILEVPFLLIFSPSKMTEVSFFSLPENSGIAYSIFDAMWGFGYSLGPVIGAFLYDCGNFCFPFYVIGAANFVS